MGALIKIVHSVCVCPTDEAFLMAPGKPLACVNVGIDAIFMFICMYVCMWVVGPSVCLCVSNEGSLNMDEWLYGNTNNAGL